MRVLVALGGNAMTGPDGSARPEDQIAAAEVAMEAVADLVAAGHRGRDHPWQRPAGRQPAGQERARRRRRAPGAARLVRRPDPGHPRLRPDGRARRRASRDAASRAASPRWSPAPASTRDDPGFSNPTKPIGRYLPARRRSVLIEHGQRFEDRGERGWRRVVASPEPREILDARRVATLLAAGYVVVAAGGEASRSSASADGRLRGVEAVIDKDLAAALLAGTLDADALVIATDVDHAMVGFGTADARPLGRVDRRRVRALRRRGAVRQRARWGPKVEAVCRFVERSAASRASSRRLDHIVAAVDGETSAPSSSPGTTDANRPVERNAADARAIEVRKVPINTCPTPASSPSSSTTGCIEADRVVAVIGKTEGNGGVNDYTRIIADRAFREVIVDEGHAARPRRSRRSRSSGPAAPTA